MIAKKKKICKECGKETYIFSKGRCKSCSTKVSSPEAIRKKEEKTKRTKELHEFMYNWWLSWKHRNCQACGIKLPHEFSTANVDHLLGKKKYPELAFELNNLFLVCLDCHGLKEMGYPKDNHKAAIERAKVFFGKV